MKSIKKCFLFTPQEQNDLIYSIKKVFVNIYAVIKTLTDAPAVSDICKQPSCVLPFTFDC